MVRKISEFNYISTFENRVSPSIFNSTGKTPLLKSVKAGTRSDSFYLTNDGLVIKINEITESQISGQGFPRLKSFYSKPMWSRSINIYKSRGLVLNSHVWSTDELNFHAKCWVMPTDNGCYIVPIIHHYS
jgi:hypothetical protein